ncbi:uncharacterized protein BcabD6B2_41830 [Babesia caballi]|uniref:Uncharacterized protein n=1 Tax=Babesia caballi TaxID=5871 RepID=A0AAV4LXM2_BABCB|nr:hypothetical protein BcabD6B2_41830 [Babesia caballi]
MATPIDVGEGLVVEGKTAEEYLGAPFLFTVTIWPLCDLRVIIVRYVFGFVFEPRHEGVLAGGEDGLGEALGTGLNLRFNLANLWRKLGGIVDATVLGNQLLKLSGDIRSALHSCEDRAKVRPDFIGNITFIRILKLTFKTFFHLTHYCIKILMILPLPLNFPKLLYFLRNPFKHPRPPPVTLGQLTDNTINILFISTVILNGTIFTKSLQHPYRKRYSRVAQPMRRHVGRSDSSAGDFRSAVTTPVIPNEVLQSLGQLGNKASTTTRTVQSAYNLLKPRTKPGAKTFNFTKQALNLLG